MFLYPKVFIATQPQITKNEAVAKTLNGSVNILPNPVTGNSFNINLVNVTKGNYKAEIYSNDGKVLLVTYMEHFGGNSTYKASLPPGTAAGIYPVSVIDSGGRLIQKTSLVVSKN